MEVNIWTVVGGAGVLLVAYLCWKVWRGPGASVGRVCKLPPVQRGWLPWLGCALDFGKQPLNYIKQTNDKHGDIFTIHVAGKWMTFLMNADSYQHFFSAHTVDFQAAVLPICQGVAGIKPSSFSRHHTDIHDSLKGRLSSSTATLCHALSNHFHHTLCSYGDAGEMQLMHFVRDAMFQSVVTQLFGEDNVPVKKEEMQKMLNLFIKYDEDFEYGADLPAIFVRDWKGCRDALLQQFKAMVDKMAATGRWSEGGGGGDEGGSGQVLEMLLEIVDKESAHNYALLLLWASQSNAVPAVFWTLCHVLSDADIYSRAKEEARALSSHREGSEFKPVEEEELKQFPYIKRCILEAVRLHAPGMIVRKVVETHNINGYTIPAGHMLMLSPYWSHRNPKYFPQPELFAPDRWLECDLENKRQFLEGFIGFGGGRYQCPGKWFALMEMHLFVAMVLNMFQLHTLDPIPPTSPLHLIGTQQPEADCRVEFSRI